MIQPSMAEDTLPPPRRWIPKSYRRRFGAAVRVELAADRRLRTRNRLHYRVLHWPIWIWVFFIAAGPITAKIFAGAPSRWTLVWFGAVIAGTGIAGIFGKLPGVEAVPYILRFGDDHPNPLYRRICYTFAWSVIVSFATINVVGLVDALASGRWRVVELYETWYFPLAAGIWLLGALGRLPRAGRSTKNEGLDRRYFYGSVWAVTTGQVVLLVLWKTMAVNPTTSTIKLIVYLAVLAMVGLLARWGFLPRTRPILAGEIARAD
jgi:hypothetical protein